MSEATASTVTVVRGESQFRFTSKRHWVSKGRDWFQARDLSSSNAIAIDAKGRICTIGAHFEAAERDGAYPVTVYLKRPS